MAKIKSLKDIVSQFSKIESDVNNLIEMTELVMMEFDEELKREILSNTKMISAELEKLELQTFLSGKYDKNNAIFNYTSRSWWNRITRLGRNAI